MTGSSRILVLGLGNALCGDDGFGPAVIARLEGEPADDPPLRLLDGGTLGLILVAAMAESDALIVIDAAATGAPPGRLATVSGAAMDSLVGGRGASAHGIGLADLLGAARLAGMLPERRALVTIAPADLTWGAGLSAVVERRIDEAARLVAALAAGWRGI